MKQIIIFKAWLILFLGWCVVASGQTCMTESILPTTGHLVNNGDGTISDPKTGLMWKQCPEGQNGADCSFDIYFASFFTWSEALQRVQTVNEGNGFAGYNDWRLPNIKELASIIERQCHNPSVNVSIFPEQLDFIQDGQLSFWSSTPLRYPDEAWTVSFYYGWTGLEWKDLQQRVRLVRNVNQ